MKTQEMEFKGMCLSGFLMLLVFFLLIAGGVCSFVFLMDDGWMPLGITLGILSILLAVTTLGGFIMVEPNEARVVMFFGKYEGTFTKNGYYWLNPFNNAYKIPLKARNLDADPIKVNDKTGNPIMIGLVMVWKVKDTYRVMFNIDNDVNATAGVATTASGRMRVYENFVKIQADAALRRIAGEYAYDNIDGHDEVTLRSSGDVVQQRLEHAISESLEIAGIEVVEARISHLAYAPEIAAVMLRRQQADAILSARHKIVEGAVSMVKMAIDKLSEEEVVELDEDKKAAMVSNLLVVLCADEAAQPVLNTGTLHQ
ncbi:MAG: SPFH domain-containing protein [Flavobacteriales bacterium]|nr:SPFH domain-containing protein [Flavobacteriales bacterium]